MSPAGVVAGSLAPKSPAQRSGVVAQPVHCPGRPGTESQPYRRSAAGGPTPGGPPPTRVPPQRGGHPSPPPSRPTGNPGEKEATYQKTHGPPPLRTKGRPTAEHNPVLSRGGKLAFFGPNPSLLTGQRATAGRAGQGGRQRPLALPPPTLNPF